MTDNYARIVTENLTRLYQSLPGDLAMNLPAEQERQRFIFDAFGEKCILDPNKISLDQEVAPPVVGILISLYALNVGSDTCILEPLKAFQDFPNSMPYIGAFKTHTEQILVSHVAAIKENHQSIVNRLNGEAANPEVSGDFAFVVYPLPKIALCYIFYEADDDFPASVTCLYSNNANRFIPMDGLADVGEYTSKKIIDLIRVK